MAYLLSDNGFRTSIAYKSADDLIRNVVLRTKRLRGEVKLEDAIYYLPAFVKENLVNLEPEDRAQAVEILQTLNLVETFVNDAGYQWRSEPHDRTATWDEIKGMCLSSEATNEISVYYRQHRVATFTRNQILAFLDDEGVLRLQPPPIGAPESTPAPTISTPPKPSKPTTPPLGAASVMGWLVSLSIFGTVLSAIFLRPALPYLFWGLYGGAALCFLMAFVMLIVRVSYAKDAASDDKPVSGLSISALTLGVASVLGGLLLLIPPMLAWILGAFAIDECNSGKRRGLRVAIAGHTLGKWLSLAMILFWSKFIIQFAVRAALAASAASHYEERVSTPTTATELMDRAAELTKNDNYYSVVRKMGNPIQVEDDSTAPMRLMCLAYPHGLMIALAHDNLGEDSNRTATSFFAAYKMNPDYAGVDGEAPPLIPIKLAAPEYDQIARYAVFRSDGNKTRVPHN